MVQTSLGIVYYERIHGERAENLELSIAAHAEALEVFTPKTSPHDWAQVQMNLGNSYCKRIHGERAENLELAITAYNQALNVYTHQAFPKHHAAASLNLGLAYQNKKNFPSAYNTFTDAIGTVEMMREQIVSEKIKRKQSEEWNKLYRYMVEICLELEKETEAIEYAERSKTRNLVETILERDFNTIFPRDVIQILEQIRDEIATGQNKIQTGKAENTKELSQYLQELRQKRNELQDKFLPVGYGFNLNKFQETLDERTGIIQWYITDISIQVFIITCDSQQWFKFSNRNNSLGILIDWLNNYMYTYSYSKSEWINSLFSCLKNLSEILKIEEILKLIPKNCTRLILIPHRYLHLLPLHTLPLSNGEVLYERFPGGVSYAPSLQILQQIQKRDRPDFKNLFAIQNPTEDLLYTDLEVDSILNIFPTHQVLAHNQATKDRLLENLPNIQEANYLHFSCHGLFNLDSPQDSCLLLADSKDEHNNLDLSKCLTLGNLFERDFQLNNCRLVVLSACETGLVDFNNTSDEYISLPSGFLYAGATSVVSSLWTVDDLSTSLLMIKFLQNFQNEIAKDENSSAALALNQAQTWIKNATKEELAAWMSNLPLDKTWKMHINRLVNALETGSKPFESPFHWAGFIAVGK
ncbi:MAG: CHAT domain-containing protein [Richelia sp. RM1_1_1]|nr:CHAT domain-containing protein [Richelia sp. RM1_1_1]